MIDRNTLTFLAGLAHELRTPLGAIGGHAELLRMGLHGPLEAAQLDVLGRIRRNQEQMIAFINECMAYASVAAGDVQLSAESVRFDEVVRQAVDALQPNAAAREIRLIVTVQADEAVASARDAAPQPSTASLHIDARAAATIVHELLADALAGSVAGGEIRVRLSGGDGVVTLQVDSDGAPITAVAAESVFVPFSHGSDGSRSASTRPLSLGHARLLARASGGDVVAETDSTTRIVRMNLPRVSSAEPVV